jgi:hypothetical protein
MVASSGHFERAHTPSQVAVQRPTSGEVMINGRMAGSTESLGSMSMSSGSLMGSGSIMRHVEVHICSKANGKPATGVVPTIEIQDYSQPNSTMAPMQVAEMTGLDVNAADTHYGNNIGLVPGHRYSVRTTLNGQSGTYDFTGPQT